MNKLVIWGASGHAKVVADIVRLTGQYEIAGFIEDGCRSPGSHFNGSVILGESNLLDCLRSSGISKLLVAVGHCEARTRLAAVARGKGFILATAIHPTATVAAGVPVGAGTVIAAGAIVSPGAVLGENVILNTSASVDHDCVVGNGVHIGPGCHLGGRTRIGRETWLGIGAIVRDRIVIGQRTIIGAGSVVLQDLPDSVVAYGVPAKVVRKAGDEIREDQGR